MVAPSSNLATVQRLLNDRRFAEAAQRLIAAADSDDPSALIVLAQWRISGDIVRRDLAAARMLLGRARAAGSDEAGLLHAAFCASEVGGPADWTGAMNVLLTLADRQPYAATQLRLIQAMTLTPDGAPADPIKRRPLSTSPHVELAERLFTPEECTYVLAVATPQLQRSLVADPRTGQMVPHPIRRSLAAMIGVHAEDVAINALNRRIAAFSRTELCQAEPLQLLSYGPSDEYRAHLDVLPAEPNQRIATVLVYLTDDYAGGETAFLKTGLKVRGRIGDAIVFRNVTADGAIDPMAEHAGLPVTRGTKQIASRWIRARRFTYPSPHSLLPI
jgi:prolyl 4-hydroxylase